MSFYMPMPFSRRLGRVKPSQTQEVTLAAQRLRRQGVSVIDLGAGEPDLWFAPNPDAIGTLPGTWQLVPKK